MERFSEEALGAENTEERMADRPRNDDTDLDMAPGALDDTAPEPGDASAVDDV